MNFILDHRPEGVVPAVERQQLRTYLFVPAHEPRKAARAMASDAGAVIFDLEAAVPDARKAEARACIPEYLRTLVGSNGPEVWVRVNGHGPQLDADLKALPLHRMAGVMMARAETSEALRAAVDAGARRIVPLVESLLGFDRLEQLAAVPGVERFAIGTWDLMLDLGLVGVTDPDDAELIWRLRADLVLASRRFALAAPIDGVYAKLSDAGGFAAVCERAYRLGFAGKLLIHPAQIAVATAVFGPSAAAVQQAREIVEAYDAAVVAGRGVIQVQGQMVDEPVVARARALLARAQIRPLAS